MAKGKKSNAPSGQAPDSSKGSGKRPAPVTTGTSSSEIQAAFARMLQRKRLVLAWISLAITVFAAWAAFKFRNDMIMGVVCEPTGIVLWSAITVTLFGSDWRDRRRRSKADS